MSMRMKKLSVMIGRNKKIVLLGVFSVLLVLSLIIFGIGVVTYKSVQFAAEKIKPLAASGEQYLTESLPMNESLPNAGFVEGVVLSLANGWLQQGVASSEFAMMRHGLSCFDALGGPSPSEILDYAKSQTTDLKVHTQLRSLEENLLQSSAQATGPSACASWLLRG